MSDVKEEEQLETKGTQPQRYRSRGQNKGLKISVAESERARLQVEALKECFGHDERFDELIKLFRNKSDDWKLHTPFNYKHEIGDKPFNCSVTVSGQNSDNVLTVELTDDLIESKNLYSPVTILRFNEKYEPIDVAVAKKLCKESVCMELIENCLKIAGDTQQKTYSEKINKMINKKLGIIQNVSDLNDKQIIGIKQRIEKYHKCKKLYCEGDSQKLTDDMVNFTMIDSAIATILDYNVCKPAYFVIRYMKEYINNGGDLEMHLFECGRRDGVNLVAQKISNIVCEKYGLDPECKRAMRELMRTWVKKNMSFSPHRIDKSFQRMFISKQQIVNCCESVGYDMKENDNELFIEWLQNKSKQFYSYNTYKTKAGFVALNLNVFGTDICNNENKRMCVVAKAHNKFDKSLCIIDVLWHDEDEIETVGYGIKSSTLPVMNTNAKIQVYVEPETNNSSLNANAETFVEKKLPPIPEEIDDTKTQNIPGMYKPTTSNKHLKMDKNDNDEKEECKKCMTWQSVNINEQLTNVIIPSKNIDQKIRNYATVMKKLEYLNPKIKSEHNGILIGNYGWTVNGEHMYTVEGNELCDMLNKKQMFDTCGIDDQHLPPPPSLNVAVDEEQRNDFVEKLSSVETRRKIIDSIPPIRKISQIGKNFKSKIHYIIKPLRKQLKHFCDESMKKKDIKVIAFGDIENGRQYVKFVWITPTITYKSRLVGHKSYNIGIGLDDKCDSAQALYYSICDGQYLIGGESEFLSIDEEKYWCNNQKHKTEYKNNSYVKDGINNYRV